MSACAGAVRRPRSSRRGKVPGGVAGRRSSNGAAARRGDDGERVPWRAACALEWGSDGKLSKEQRGGSKAASAAVQRRSEPGARVPCRACTGRRKGGEREGREKERVNVLTCVFLKIFHGNSKNFEHESCSKFKILQLSFQVKLHLSNNLKVNNLKSSLNEKPLNPLFFGVFTKFHVVT